MNTYKKITIFFIFIFLTSTLWSQADVRKTLYLKDGSFLLGSLVGKSTTEYIWQLSDGTRLSIPSDQVRYIKEQKSDFRYLKDGKIKQTKGLFTSVMVGALFEKKLNEWSEPDHAPSANLTIGYHVNSKISVGIGTGYDAYEVPIIPLYLDLRGDLLNAPVSPYYKVSLGYGFIMPKEYQKNNENLELSGGILFHPSVGVKFYTRSSLAWLFDFGYRFQRYDEQLEWELNPRRWTLQRATFRIGMEF